MRKNQQIHWPLCIALLFCLLLPGFAAAADGDGGGDGSGGGKQQPLVIESVVPADGSAGVALTPEIKITFNKNVCYMTVRESNRNCFSMWTGNTRIPIEVIMADDQVEREKRNDAIVKPLQKLQAGTLYRIEIAPNMESKSGVTLGQKATVTFTTAGAAAGEQPAQQTGEPASSPSTPPTNPQAAAPSESSPSGAVEGRPDMTQQETESGTVATAGQEQVQPGQQDVAEQKEYRNKRIAVDLVIVAVAGLGAWWLYRKRRGL